jgi:hypothetical protein
MDGRGLHYAKAIDDQEQQIVTLVLEDYNAQNRNRDWENQ